MFLTMFDQRKAMVSVDELKALQNDLRDMQAIVRQHPEAEKKLLEMMCKIEGYVEIFDEDMSDLEMQHSHMLELPTLIQQAQRQCQQ